MSWLNEEITHFENLFHKDAPKLKAFFAPILADIKAIVEGDAEGDLSLFLTTVPTGGLDAAVDAVRGVVAKQGLQVGEAAIQATAQALQTQLTAVAAAPVAE